MCDLEKVGMTADAQTAVILNGFCAGTCHVSSIKLQVKSLEALKLACQRLGLEFREGQATYRWYGMFIGDAPLPEGFTKSDLGKCNHAIHVPGAAYEIGLVQRDGAWQMLWDSWEAGGLEAVLGKDAERLRHAYGVEAAKLAAQKEGYSVYEEQMEDGTTKLHIQVGV